LIWGSGDKENTKTKKAPRCSKNKIPGSDFCRQHGKSIKDLHLEKGKPLREVYETDPGSGIYYVKFDGLKFEGETKFHIVEYVWQKYGACDRLFIARDPDDGEIFYAGYKPYFFENIENSPDYAFESYIEKIKRKCLGLDKHTADKLLRILIMTSTTIDECLTPKNNWIKTPLPTELFLET